MSKKPRIAKRVMSLIYNCYADLNCAAAILKKLEENRWLKESKDSKKYFPDTGLSCIKEKLQSMGNKLSSFIVEEETLRKRLKQ